MAVSIAPAAASPLAPVGPSPQSLKKRQDLMDAMLANATKVRPVNSILEGMTQLGSAALAGWWGGEADREADAKRSEASAKLQPLIEAMLGGGAGGALAPSGAPAAGGWQQPAMGDNLMSRASEGSFDMSGLPEWQRVLATRESGGDPGIVNSGGYTGRYQFGEGAAHDAGFYSGDDNLRDNQWGGTFTGPNGETLNYEQWRQSPEAQDYGFGIYAQGLQDQFRAAGLDRYIGQTVNGVQVTLPGLIMGAHLGGVGGLRRWLTGGGNAADSNGTKVGDYVAMGSAFPDMVPAVVADAGRMPALPEGTDPGQFVDDSPYRIGAPIDGSAMMLLGGKEKGPQYLQDAGKPDLTTMLGTPPLQLSPPYGQAPGSDLNPLPAEGARGLPQPTYPSQNSQIAQPAEYNGTMGFAPAVPAYGPSAIGGLGVGPARPPQQAMPAEIGAMGVPGAQDIAAQPYAQPGMPVTGAPPSIMAQPIDPMQAQQQAPQMAQTMPSPNAMPDTFGMLEQQGAGQPPPTPMPAAGGGGAGAPPPVVTAAAAPDKIPGGPGGMKTPGRVSDGTLTASYGGPGKMGGGPGVPQGGGQDRQALLAQLVAAMSDPWLDDGSKQIAGMLLTRAMQEPDAVRGIMAGDLLINPETGEIMGNYGQPDAADWQKFDDNTLFDPATGQTRDIGPDALKPAETRTVDRGGEQVTEQWDAQTGQWTEIGRSPRWNPDGGTTINNMGNIPAGYEVFTDPASGATRMRPIPGGPADIEMQAADAKTQGASADAAAQGGLVIQDIQKALDLVEGNQGFTVGPLATIGRINSAGAGQQLVDLLDTVKANIGFSQIQQMRENSPTGGALGQVTERELAFLQASLGSLNPNGSPELLRRNLQRLLNLYMDQVHGTPEVIRHIGPSLGLSPEQIEQLAARYPIDGAASAEAPAAAAGAGAVEAYVRDPATGRLVLAP